MGNLSVGEKESAEKRSHRRGTQRHLRSAVGEPYYYTCAGGSLPPIHECRLIGCLLVSTRTFFVEIVKTAQRMLCCFCARSAKGLFFVAVSAWNSSCFMSVGLFVFVVLSSLFAVLSRCLACNRSHYTRTTSRTYIQPLSIHPC